LRYPVAPGVKPIDYIKQWVRSRSQPGVKSSIANRVLIVEAKTGSGKSTMLPVEMFRLNASGGEYYGPSVICTQPRVLTAIDLAEQADASPFYPEMEIGVNVGYQTGSRNLKPRAGLIYATAGTLAKQLETHTDDEIAELYKIIMIDEAHELSIDNELMLSEVRDFSRRYEGRSNMPFVMLTSATFDVEKIARYFGVTTENTVKVDGAPVDVETIYPAIGTNDYVEEATQTALKIHRENTEDSLRSSDILIFMPTKMEIEDVAKRLIEAQKRNYDPAVGAYAVLSVMREDVQTVSRDYREIHMTAEKMTRHPSLEGIDVLPANMKRRIIVANNVAETGLTIETLRYVIDSGWANDSENYPLVGLSLLAKRPISKDRALQRRGRAGRKAHGKYYPMFTRNVFESLEPEALPDTVSQGVQSIFLKLVARAERDGKQFNPNDLGLLDPPTNEGLLVAMTDATYLGFYHDRALTKLGTVAARMSMATRLSMYQIRLVLGLSTVGSCSDAATAAALMERQQPMKIFSRQINELMAARLHKSIEPEVAVAELRSELAVAVIAFETIMRACAAVKGVPAEFEAWMAERKISANEVAMVMARRDDIYEALLEVNVDVRRRFGDTLGASDELAVLKQRGLAFRQVVRDSSVGRLMTSDTGVTGGADGCCADDTYPAEYLRFYPGEDFDDPLNHDGGGTPKTGAGEKPRQEGVFFTMERGPVVRVPLPLLALSNVPKIASAGWFGLNARTGSPAVAWVTDLDDIFDHDYYKPGALLES
jgi:HrpA-like RNA helicase